MSIDRLPFRIGRRQAGEGADILSANDLALRDQYPYQISRNHCAIERHMVLPLKPGTNKLVLGGDDSSFQFNVQVDPA
ncbi:MAG: hypothetical protein EBS49_04005 [Verrucomicrobia bacterium]|nr:hypothetical protein [Verrucomicrobiota bacterium]